MKQSVTLVGGGIIGLSIAYELLKRNWKVTLIESNQFGRAASWAGAGILLPANRLTANHPLEHLSALSNRMHEIWASELSAETGIDNGFHRCGGLYVARSPGEIASLSGLQFQLADQKIELESLDADRVRELPFVRNNFENLNGIKRALYLNDESQICNPHHVQALIAACRSRGAVMHEHCRITQIVRDRDSGQIKQVKSETESFESDQFVFTAGPWTEATTAAVAPLPMVPVRGQIVMFKLEEPQFAPIIYEGSHYLVPRRDGHVLAGATIEEAGFDCSTTSEAEDKLLNFASRLFPSLNARTKVKHWSGLRPTTYDGFPYLGPIPDIQNGLVAAGHFRLGIQLSTGTAAVIADLLEKKTPEIDLVPFSPSRIHLDKQLG